jgi:low affinity Fe/Cu permease
MHFVNLNFVFGVTFIFGTAIAALFMKLFNYAGTLGCWIRIAKNLCSADLRYCARRVGAEDFEVYFGLLPLALYFLFVVVAMIVLYCMVRRIKAWSLRWQFEYAHGGSNDSITGMPLSQRTLETGVLYSASFISVYLPTALVGALPFFDYQQEQALYINLLIVIVLLLPLQGFFNMLIYTSPMWLPWRIHHLKLCFCCSVVKK